MKSKLGFISEIPATNLMNQIGAGVWLSVIVGLGILSQSWSVVVSLTSIGAFFAAGAIALHFLRAKNIWVRRAAKAGTVLYLGTFVFGGLMIAERMYYLNADTYPVWLTSGIIEKYRANFDTVRELRDTECKDYGYMLFTEKRNGLYYARCGDYWFNSRTFVFPFDPTELQPDAPLLPPAPLRLPQEAK